MDKISDTVKNCYKAVVRQKNREINKVVEMLFYNENSCLPNKHMKTLQNTFRHPQHNKIHNEDIIVLILAFCFIECLFFIQSAVQKTEV